MINWGGLRVSNPTVFLQTVWQLIGLVLEAPLQIVDVKLEIDCFSTICSAVRKIYFVQISLLLFISD